MAFPNYDKSKTSGIFPAPLELIGACFLCGWITMSKESAEKSSLQTVTLPVAQKSNHLNLRTVRGIFSAGGANFLALRIFM